MKRTGGYRRKTRSKLRKKEKGKISIRKYLQEFKNGERVILKAEPAVQKGIYFRRFHGKTGKVIGKKGDCYKVLIKDLKKDKEIVIHPIHLKKV